MSTPTKDLIRQFGYWGEHPDHPVSDWQSEVANRDTRRSYWAWVAARIEAGL
jgi:hypothetical protein